MPTNPPDKIDFSNLTTCELLDVKRGVQDGTDAVSARRQNMNAVFVGFNTVVLSGLGAVLVTMQLNPWRLELMIAALALSILPLNLIWLRSVQVYNTYVTARQKYMQGIEDELKKRWGDNFVGLYQLLAPRYRGIPQGRFVDVRLVAYFILLYPTIAMVLGVVTLLIDRKLLLPIP